MLAYIVCLHHKSGHQSLGENLKVIRVFLVAFRVCVCVHVTFARVYICMVVVLHLVLPALFLEIVYTRAT